MNNQFSFETHSYLCSVVRPMWVVTAAGLNLLLIKAHYNILLEDNRTYYLLCLFLLLLYPAKHQSLNLYFIFFLDVQRKMQVWTCIVFLERWGLLFELSVYLKTHTRTDNTHAHTHTHSESWHVAGVLVILETSTLDVWQYLWLRQPIRWFVGAAVVIFRNDSRCLKPVCLIPFAAGMTHDDNLKY